MVVEKPSVKSLRLTAIDSTGQIKIYLAMVSFKIFFYLFHNMLFV